MSVPFDSRLAVLGDFFTQSRSGALLQGSVELRSTIEGLAFNTQ